MITDNQDSSSSKKQNKKRNHDDFDAEEILNQSEFSYFHYFQIIIFT